MSHGVYSTYLRAFWRGISSALIRHATSSQCLAAAFVSLCVVDYLSDAWIAAANRALAAESAQFGTTQLTIYQQVLAARSYVVHITDQGASLVAAGQPDPPPGALCFAQDWSTACRIAQGETDAHQAFLLGDITFSGEIASLLSHAATFEHLATILAPVMAQTVFPEEFSGA